MDCDSCKQHNALAMQCRKATLKLLLLLLLLDFQAEGFKTSSKTINALIQEENLLLQCAHCGVKFMKNYLITTVPTHVGNCRKAYNLRSS